MLSRWRYPYIFCVLLIGCSTSPTLDIFRETPPPNAGGPMGSPCEDSEPESELGYDPVPGEGLFPSGDPAPGEKPFRSAEPLPPGPVLTPEIQKLRRAAQDHVLGKRSPPGPHALPYAGIITDKGTIITATSLPDPVPDENQPPPALGTFVPIEPESSLDHFHRALHQLATSKESDRKVRILAYGASHTQGDVYTGYLRSYLQSRFGDGGQGFVLFGKINKWYRTLDTLAEHRSLSLRHARYRLDVEDEPLGLFGAALVGSTANAYGEILTSTKSPNTRFEAHYYKQPQGGDFELLVDGQVVDRIETDAPTAGPAYHSFETSPGQRRIRARLIGNGPVRLFGITAETAHRGVVVDTLGIGGARMSSSLRWDKNTWLDAIRHRNPDLVTFAYGTNEATNAALSMENYERRVREVLLRLRKAGPDFSCLLIAPFDYPRGRDGSWVSRPVIKRVVEAQRRISAEVGCGFWDGYAFMGGEGSMHRWVSANPPFGARDHIHLTRIGYTYVGIAIGDALMRRYDGNPTQSVAASTGSVPSPSSPPPSPASTSPSEGSPLSP